MVNILYYLCLTIKKNIHMKTIKITYWATTGLLSALMIMSAGMYLFTHEEAVTSFQNLGFPTFIIYPLAFAKIAGVIVLLMPKRSFLKHWAYSAFFFNFLIALGAHLVVSDGMHMIAVIAILLLLTSFYTYLKLTPAKS